MTQTLISITCDRCGTSQLRHECAGWSEDEKKRGLCPACSGAPRTNWS